MNMSKEEYHKRVNKMYSELRTDRVDVDREEVIRCQRLYLAEDRYIPSCEREIERLTAESTEWESKFYDEAKKVDKAIEYLENIPRVLTRTDVIYLLMILKGDDKE